VGVSAKLTALWLGAAPAAAAPGDCHEGSPEGGGPWIEAPPGLIAVVAARPLGWAHPAADHLAEHLAVGAAARAAPLGPAGGRWEGGAGPWGVELVGVAHASHPEAEARLRRGIAAALGPLELDPDRIADELRTLRAEAPPSWALRTALAAAGRSAAPPGTVGAAVEALRTDPGAWLRGGRTVVWVRPADGRPSVALTYGGPTDGADPERPRPAVEGAVVAGGPARDGGRVTWALPAAARADAEALELVGRAVALAAGGRSWSGWGPGGGVVVVEGARGDRAVDRALRAPDLRAAGELAQAARRAQGPLDLARLAAALGRCPRDPGDPGPAALRWLGLALPPPAPGPLQGADAYRPDADEVYQVWTHVQARDPSADPREPALRAARAARVPGLWLEEGWGVWAQATGPGAEADIRGLLAPARPAALRRAGRAVPGGWSAERAAVGAWPSGPDPGHVLRARPGGDPVEAALWLAVPAPPELASELAVRAWADPSGGPLGDALQRAGVAPHGHQLDLIRGEGLLWARVGLRSPADALGAALGAVDEARRGWALQPVGVPVASLLRAIAVDLLAAAPGEALRRWARTGIGPYALDAAGALGAELPEGRAEAARRAVATAPAVWVLTGDPGRVLEALSRSGRSAAVGP